MTTNSTARILFLDTRDGKVKTAEEVLTEVQAHSFELRYDGDGTSDNDIDCWLEYVDTCSNFILLPPHYRYLITNMTDSELEQVKGGGE